MMLTTSARTLNILAAFVWIVGGLVLLFKGGSLLAEAGALKPSEVWPWLAVVAALLIGGFKGRTVFSKSCRRNLERIAALPEPRLWQFFRPGFFVALAAMIATGATLSRLAQGRYPALIGVAILDLSLATALLGSSIVFWRQRALVRAAQAGQ
jgi:hypothetical protein